MKDAQFIRDRHIVKNVATGEVTDHKSISKAKRWSLEFQKQNGGIGCGVVRVKR
jgi:hypothetical protein